MSENDFKPQFDAKFDEILNRKLEATKAAPEFDLDKFIDEVEWSIATFDRPSCVESAKMLSILKSQAAEIAELRREIDELKDDHIAELAHNEYVNGWGLTC